MPAFSVRDEDLLASALGEPRQTWAGQFLHRTIHDKAAVLIRSLIKNHPLIDGNKRTGLAALEVFLLLNRYALRATQQERIGLALQVATGAGGTSQVMEIARWVRSHSFRIHQIGALAVPGLADPERWELTSAAKTNLMFLMERLFVLGPKVRDVTLLRRSAIVGASV